LLRPDRPGPVARNGFTLLEMMVALAVFSLAALSLIRLQGYSLRSTGDIEAHSMGRIVAQNVATAFLTSPAPPPIGKSSGTLTNGGRAWRWQMDVARTDDARIIRAAISVTPAQGGSAQILDVARPVEQ